MCTSPPLICFKYALNMVYGSTKALALATPRLASSYKHPLPFIYKVLPPPHPPVDFVFKGAIVFWKN